MTIHFLKPALGAQDVYEFSHRQQQRYIEHNGHPAFPVWTSRRPARQNDLINGGSVYWIVKNQIQCRQEILDIREIQENEQEKPAFLLLCSTKLIRTKALPRRAFQGWRYLEPSNIPADIGEITTQSTPPPKDMEPILREAGLL